MIQCKKIDSLGVVINTTGKTQGTLIYVGINPQKNESTTLIEQPLLKKPSISTQPSKLASKLNSRTTSKALLSPESQVKTPKTLTKKIQILSNEKLQVANELFKKKKKSSGTKPKKKKCHMKSKSIAIKSEGQMQSRYDPEREQYIQMLVGSSVEQFKKNLIQQKLEKQMERQRHSSMQEFMKYMDFEVRKSNAERFVKKKSPSVGQLPWGIDQQKLREYWHKMIHIHSRLQTSKSPHQMEKDDKQRRQDIGLGFLNTFSESFIKEVVKKQKDDFIKKTSPEKTTERIKTKPKNPSCDETQLKSYMLSKQAEWKQKKEQEKIYSQLQQQKVKANLQLLESEIEVQKKRIYSQNSGRHNSSIKCKSTGVPNSRKFSQPLLEQNYTQEQQQQLMNLEYEYLQQEQAKLFNWRQSPRSQLKKQIPTKVHMRQISSPSTGNGLTTPQSQQHQNQDFIAWLQQLPESFLEQQLFQMQVINQQMNAQGFNYILSENEQYQFLEEFLKEKFKQHQKSLLISKSVPNLSGVQSFPHSQLQSVPESRKISQKPICESSSHKGLRERHQKLAERWNKTPMARQNRAAITIQKYWRGFRTRQMVYQYLQMLLDQDKVIHEQIPEESSQRKTPHVATQSDKVSFQPLSQMGSLLGSQVTQQLPSPVLSQTSEVLDTPFKKNEFDDHPFSDPMFGGFQPDELGSSKNSRGSSPSQMLIRSVLGVPKNFASSNKQHGASSGSLITIQELHTEIQQRKQKTPLKTPQKTPQKTPDRETKVSQTAMWEQLLKELNEFKQSEKHLSRRAANFINNLQKQSETNLKLIEQQEQQQIKIAIEQVDEMAQTEMPQLLDHEEQTSQQMTSSLHDSKDHHHIDPDFHCNIYKVISQREHLIDQKYQEQLRIMELMLEQKKVSIEQFQRNKDRLDKKVQIDKENLGENKNELERMRRLFEDTIKLTQKDISFIEKMKKHPSEHDESLRQILSLRSDSEQSDSDIRYSRGRQTEEPVVDDLVLSLEEIEKKQDLVDQRLDLITEVILQEQIEQFANELNQFPLQSLGVLMEWDEESDVEVKNKFIPGFPTTLNFVKDYLIAFSDFIERNFINSFIQQINTPLGISPMDLLKTISLSDPQAINNDESTAGPLYPLIKHIHMMEPVIDEEVWDRFNQEYAQNLKYLSMNEPEYIQMKECEIFHLKMIYDSFNEALNCIRPYGLRGQPYPWRCNPQKVYQNKTQPNNIEKAMGFGIAKMLKWGAFLCGFIPEKIETPQGEVILIEEDYLNQIKEDRLQQMLEHEIQENEEKWLNYEEELTEVCVEMADIVFESMLDEASEELFTILLREKAKIK